MSHRHFAFASLPVVAASVGLAACLLAAPVSAQTVDKDLEQRIAKEKEDRKACKARICDAALNKKADGGDIACAVVKTWTVEELKAKVLRGKVDWPLGHAQCNADLKLSRAALATALTSGEHEVKLDKHTLSCTLDQKDGKDKYSISFAVQPVVKFKDGKAGKVVLNWTDIAGSAVAKGAVWSAAALDNHLGVLEGTAADAVNEFFGPHCEEVKDAFGK